MRYTASGGGSFEVCSVPGRKKPALCLVHGCELRVVALFRDENAADEFEDFMGKFLNLREGEKP